MKIKIGVTAKPSNTYMTYEFNSQKELEAFIKMLTEKYPTWTWKKVKE